MTENEEFFFAKERAMADFTAASSGIGTLGEKLVHKTLKLYLEPRESFHEISFLGSVADIKNEKGIVEIQTRAFDRLRPKLLKFLPEVPVTVVYPIIRKKRIFWLDKDTGEITPPRKSPRDGRLSDALFELSRIKELLFSENLTVRIILLDADEYRRLDGWDKTRKRGGGKIDRIPTAIAEEYTVRTKSDLARLIPDGLFHEFTSADFSRRSGLRGRRASYSLSLLYTLGLLTRRKEGRGYLYSLADGL